MTGRRGFLFGLVAGVLCGAAGAVIVLHSDLGLTGKQTKAILDTRVIQMTPEQFVSRCGNLSSDELICQDRFGFDIPCPRRHGRPEARKVTVRMTLPDGEQKNVTAKFASVTRKKGEFGWALSQVGGYTPDTGPLGGLNTIEELYPCTTKP